MAGVIAATRGNSGQSVTFASVGADLRAVIVVPHGNGREQNAVTISRMRWNMPGRCRGRTSCRSVARAEDHPQ
jgi:threonine synthase